MSSLNTSISLFSVSVECIECNETLFSMDAPAGQEGGEEEDPYPYQEPDGEDESA